MIQIFGPENRQHYMSANSGGDGFTPVEGVALRADVATLGAALRAYEQEYAVLIEPYDGGSESVPFWDGEEPKYFYYGSSGTNRALVDVHVFRAGSEICPKQNLSFQLLDGDVIEIGELIC